MDYKIKYLNYKKNYLILKNQLGGNNNSKYIYPDCIPGYSEIKNYLDYVSKFENYLHYESKNLKDLWLMIGATNKEIEGETYFDNTRFNKNYDITINGDYNDIDIKSKNLISLSYEFTLIVDELQIPIYKDIYDFLNKYLQNKFSKIIFDWSVTKFVYLHNIIPKLLTLLEPCGELFINTFKWSGIKNVNIFKKNNNKYFLHSQFGDIINLNDSKVMNELTHYSSQYQTIIIYTDMILKIYNLKELSKKADLDGGVTKKNFDEHISNSENERIENDEYVKQVIKDYETIIDYSKYSLEYIYDKYPNESIRQQTDIYEYFIIKRLF